MNKNFKNKNKGFTLIELLAVIVILAVIALIAVPQILNILSSARKSAAESSALSIAKSADKYVQDFMMKNYGGFPEETVTFECSKEGCKLQTELTDYNITKLEQLGFQGAKPTGGTVTITEGGNKVTASNLEINGYYCNYDGEKSWCETEYIEPKFGGTVIKKEEFSSKGIVGGYEGVLAIIYLDPTDLTKECNEKNSVSITGTNTGCMKWYVYKDDGTNYTMISDHNITDTIAWNSTDGESTTNYNGPKEVLNALSTATSNWSEKLVAPTPYTASWTYSGTSHTYTINYSTYGNKARLISAEEVAEITGASKTTENNGIGWTLSDKWFYLDGAESEDEIWQTPVGSSSKKSKYAWLFNNTEDCTYYGCNVAQSGNSGYWTSSASASYSAGAWYVDYYGTLDYSNADLYDSLVFDAYYYGVRPVITVNKSDLLQ